MFQTEDIFNTLSREINDELGRLSEEQRIGITTSATIEALNKYIDRRLLDKNIEIQKEIPESYLLVLNNIGLTSDVIDEIIDVSVGPSPYELGYNVTKATEHLLNNIVNALKSIVENKLDPHFKEQIRNKNVRINAWFVATYMYASWKILLFNNSRKTLIEPILKSCTDWLISESVFIQNGEEKGWNDGQIGDAKESRDIMLYDTSFVANILIRIDPNRSDSLYENCLDTIIKRYNTKNPLCFNPLSMEKDIAGSSYVLRLLSNYLIRRPEKYYMNYSKNDLVKIQYEICNALSDEFIISSKWLSNSENEYRMQNSENPIISNKAKIALMIHAIRSIGKPRDWLLLENGCDWLLDQLECINGTWCWTVDTKEGKKPNAFESSLIVSALLHASTYSKFSKALLVIDWLLNQVKDGYLDNTNDFGTVICCLADYLRAWNERQFFIN